jgi:hypothetical protein
MQNGFLAAHSFQAAEVCNFGQSWMPHRSSMFLRSLRNYYLLVANFSNWPVVKTPNAKMGQDGPNWAEMAQNGKRPVLVMHHLPL